ncbi:MAG: hypothetical protein KAH57_02240 [Thermoplasmata archaeon]|nr:hypothetical protein [Thermoplasmata archaeon]
MKSMMLIAITAGLIMITLGLSNVIGNDDDMLYEDEEEDLFVIGESTGHEDDVDILSLTCDRSSDPVALVMTVKGEITAEYGENGTNNYVFSIDLDGDEDTAEIGVQMTGVNSGNDQFFTAITPENTILLDEDHYTISGSTVTVYIDQTHFGEASEVLDISGTTLQMFNSSTVMDQINNKFGEDDTPYGYEEPTADDDDETPDGNETDDDEDTPGLSIILISASAILVAMFIGRSRKK